MNAGNRPMVEIRGLRKSYGKTEVLRSIDLTVAPGEVLCVLGPSGSGKSTLLQCVNHLEPIDAGEVYVDGARIGYTERRGRRRELPDREVSRSRQGIGMVFQQFGLFGHMSVLENVTAGLRLVKRLNRSEADARGRQLLDRVGLGDRTAARVSQLSGGQQQRVAIARALVVEPTVLLADEPTGNLDTASSAEIMKLLVELNKAGRTVVIITHEEEIAEFAKRIVRVRDGQIISDQEQSARSPMPGEGFDGL